MEYDQDHEYDESDTEEEYDRSRSGPAGPPTDYDTSPDASSPSSNEPTPRTFTQPGSLHPSPKGNITGWTAEQCAEYVAGLGPEFERYANKIADEEVTGEALVAIHHDELKEIGIASLGHRLTILKGVYDIKVKQNVPVEPEHYVPLSADANAPENHATQHDISRIVHQIKLRDEKFLATEAELRRLQEIVDRVYEEARRLREDMLPALRLAKESKPLPNPDGMPDTLPSPHAAVHNPLQQPLDFANNNGKQPESLSRSLSRKFSTKKLYLGGNSSKMPSPTIHEGSALDGPGSNNIAYLNSSQPSPTSPPYNMTTNLTSRAYPQRPATADVQDRDNNSWYSSTSTIVDHHQPPHRVVVGPAPPRRAPPQPQAPQLPPLSSMSSMTTLNSPSADSTHSTLHPNTLDTDRDREFFSSTPFSTSSTTSLTPTPTPHSATSATSNNSHNSNNSTNSNNEFMKSFRVSMEEPCHKVLPVALKKYHINDDWRQYSLYIVHGDQERCLGLEEKPLILFKQLEARGKKPMFMLRRHGSPAGMEGFVRTRVPEGGGPERTGLAGGLV